LIGPPFSKEWQVWQILVSAWPLAMSALASSSGNGVSGAAVFAAAAGASLAPGSE